VVELASEAAEAFDDHRYEAQEFSESEGCVVVTVRRRGRGKASGIDVDEAQWHVWRFEADRAVELRIFVDERAALEAAGIDG
jgi:ketosteroid isomerase-like protein